MRTEPPTGDDLGRLLASMKQNVLQQTAAERPARTERSSLVDRLLAVLLAVGLLLGIGAGAAFALGLVPGPAETQSAPATATATPNAPPSVTPTPPASEYVVEPAPVPVAASITISATAVAVLTENGAELAAFDYFQPADEIVATFTALFGSPVVSEHVSRGDGFTGTLYDWDGIRVHDDTSPGTAPHHPEFSVSVLRADVAGLSIRTAPGVGSSGGISIGDPATELTIGVEDAVESTEYQTGRLTRWTRIGITDPLPPVDDLPGGPYNFGVGVTSYTDTGLIERFGAPSPNWGP